MEVGSGIAVFAGNNLKTTLRYGPNERCTNIQARQVAILKALEHIHLKEEEKTALVYTDSRITLQLPRNHKRRTHLIEQIRNEVMDMERNGWKVEFSWTKVHIGQRGNDRQRKQLEARTLRSTTIESRKVQLQVS